MKPIARTCADVAVTTIDVAKALFCTPSSIINLPNWLLPGIALYTSNSTKVIGTNKEARAVVEGTKKAKMKFTTTSTASVRTGVFPKRVTSTNAMRFPKLEALIAEVNTKAATISQMMS